MSKYDETLIFCLILPDKPSIINLLKVLFQFKLISLGFAINIFNRTSIPKLTREILTKIKT